MGMSDYLEEKILNHIFRKTVYTPPDEIYVALYTSDPTDADVGVEVSGGSYARQLVTFTEPVQVGGRGTIKNTEDVAFPSATASWGTVTHVGIRDASVGGNLLYHGELPIPKTISANDGFRIFAGELNLDIN